MAPGILSKLNAVFRRQEVPRSLSLIARYSVSTSKIDESCSSTTLDLTKPTGLRCPTQRNHNWCFLNSFYASRCALYSARAALDVSFDVKEKESSNCSTWHDVSTPKEEASISISSNQSLFGGKTVTLLSGSCYLPNPDKEVGEDAHFICLDNQAIGVADGVSGCADAGLFACELMSNSVRAIQEETEGSINLTRVLEKAHSSTKAKGSSTACIIALTEKVLRAINLGDSGFIVINQNGRTIFRSPTQQHRFNVTYRLESGGNGGDLPASGEVFTIPVVPGDVVIAGTDGLFDNLYKNEVIAIVVSAIRAGLDPQATAKRIAESARHRSMDRNRQTPFSIASLEAGFRYYGGKPDDITVIVSYITISSLSSNKFYQLGFMA